MSGTIQQLQRALRKAASKFPLETENFPMTDIILQVKQEGGELLIFDDNEEELTRCVVEEWIGDTSEDFYERIQPVLKEAILDIKEEMDSLNVLKPYSFVLFDDDNSAVANLYLVDDDLIQLDGELLPGLDEDLEGFWEALSKE
ncbi:hypothetical protein [Alloprevotella rava]|uniref:Uncharacterized protein n=2 Tax=Alloprevotella rava TaxID=671218 RepID=G5GA67_9BACT|nr:hypothetical protein [Alloprevotella rava]EHG24267.1 hypothetical protein HMPREF9332_00468 [Alloprevotella rava F0323]MBB3702619.1 hypothetical protein [Alloprevotella rava]